MKISALLMKTPNKNSYAFLHDLPVASYNNATSQILIGMKHRLLTVPTEVRHGAEMDLIATKTKLKKNVFVPKYQQRSYGYGTTKYRQENTEE